MLRESPEGCDRDGVGTDVGDTEGVSNGTVGGVLDAAPIGKFGDKVGTSVGGSITAGGWFRRGNLRVTCGL